MDEHDENDDHFGQSARFRLNGADVLYVLRFAGCVAAVLLGLRFGLVNIEQLAGWAKALRESPESHWVVATFLGPTLWRFVSGPKAELARRVIRVAAERAADAHRHDLEQRLQGDVGKVTSGKPVAGKLDGDRD